jgi:hypothetical protein
MTAPVLSDRRRIELALGPSCLVRIVSLIAKDPEADRAVLDPIARAFTDAALAPLGTWGLDRGRVLINRLYRVRAGLLREFEDRTVAVAYVAVARWLQRLTTAGILVLEDGPFVEAYARLLAEIEHRPENLQLLADVDRSATKAARRMHRWLRQQGYFTDHPDPFQEEP